MKFDFADLEENYTPRDIPVELGITREDIYESWNKVLKTYGGRWLRYPIVTYDPDIPVHFGISMNWRVLFNLAYLPPNLPKDKILWWIEHLPIQHEFGHYHICPYSGSDIARYIAIVKKMKPLLSRQHVFYILNFFSDLLVKIGRAHV